MHCGQDEVSICACKVPEDETEMGCLNDCLNRAVSTGKSSLHALLDEIVVKLVLMEALDACDTRL